MLDRSNIHHSAILEPQLTKKPSKKKLESDKLKKKGKTDGLRQRPIHNANSSTNVS